MTYHKHKQDINLVNVSLVFVFFFICSVANATVIETINFETGDYSQCSKGVMCHYRPDGCMGGNGSSCIGSGRPMKIDSSGATRSGSYSSKHTLYNCAMRSEIKGDTTVIGKIYWYGWSYYIPEDFNQDSYTIVNQMSAWPLDTIPDTTPMPGGGVGHKLDVKNTGWYYTLQRSDGNYGSEYDYDSLGSLAKGVWTDFVMHVKWTGNEDGFLTIWKNGDTVLDYEGRTWWNDEGAGPFFTGGEYKGQNYWSDTTGDPDPVIIYLDEVRVGDSSSSYGEVYPPTAYNLKLEEDTVKTDELLTHKVTNSITVDPEGGSFLIEGNGSDGGSVSLNAMEGEIILKPGFEAKPGSSFLAIIGEGIGESEMSTNKKFLSKAFEYKKDKKEKGEEIPKVFSCAQNFPNPFSNNTTIKYGLPKDTEVQLEIYNLIGQKVKTLVNAKQSAGYKSVSWNGETNAGIQAPKGVYFYTFKAGDFKEHRKMVLIK